MIEADVQPREGATTVSAADRSDAEVILSAERGDDPETVAALVEQFIQMNNPPVTFSEPSRAWNETKRWAEANE